MAATRHATVSFSENIGHIAIGCAKERHIIREYAALLQRRSADLREKTQIGAPRLVRRLYQQGVYALEATRQLVTSAPTLTFVVLKVIGLERQGALARLQHQRGVVG